MPFFERSAYSFRSYKIWVNVAKVTLILFLNPPKFSLASSTLTCLYLEGGGRN